MTQKSDFANVLLQALKNSGFYYTGIVDISDEEFNAYKDLSPKVMAEKYAKSHALKEKTKVFTIVRGVYEDTLKDVQVFKLREAITEQGLPVNEYMYAFQNSSFFTTKGTAAKRKYVWVGKSKPIFSDAVEIYDFVTELISYRIDPKIKNFVKDNLDMDFDKLNATVNPSKDLKLAFKLRIYLGLQKNYKKKELAPKPPVTFERELSRKAPEVEEKIEDKVIGEVQSSVKESKDSDTMVNILEQRAKYYKKLLKLEKQEYKKRLKVKNDYIKSLEKELSTRKIPITDVSGSM